MSISLLENFLPQEYVDQLAFEIGHHYFPWFWRPSTRYGIEEEGKDSKDFQFVHIMYHEGSPMSEAWGLVQPVLFAFEEHTGITIKDVYKVKANLTTKLNLTEAEQEEATHVDIIKGDKKYLTIVYYVIDSDGDTVVIDDETTRVSPRKGTAVYFPSELNHRPTPPLEHKRRIVLNIIVEVE